MLSAGGQLEQPSDVNSSTTTGVRACAPACVPARAAASQAVAIVRVSTGTSICPTKYHLQGREFTAQTPLNRCGGQFHTGVILPKSDFDNRVAALTQQRLNSA